MKLVIIESPFHAPTILGRWLNKRYARRCMADCLSKNEAPFASHLLYTQVLNDLHPSERALGIHAGLAWGVAAEKTVVYVDYGYSNGMKQGIAAAKKNSRPIEYRSLYGAAVLEREVSDVS